MNHKCLVTCEEREIVVTGFHGSGGIELYSETGLSALEFLFEGQILQHSSVTAQSLTIVLLQPYKRVIVTYVCLNTHIWASFICVVELYTGLTSWIHSCKPRCYVKRR
jgi:hypothetical protein